MAPTDWQWHAQEGTDRQSLSITIYSTRKMRGLLAITILAFVVCLLQQKATSFSIKSAGRSMVAARSNVGSSLLMKGKGSKIPIQNRGEYMKRQRIMEQQQAMERSKPKDVPIFRVFVRAKAGGPWIPSGDLAGDQRAAALVNAWMSGFLADVYKGQMDRGVAQAVFSQEDALVKTIKENFKPFKNYTKEQLEFGYKVDFKGVEEKMGEQKPTVLTKGMEKGWFDNLKEGFSGIFTPKTDSEEK